MPTAWRCAPNTATACITTYCATSTTVWRCSSASSIACPTNTASFWKITNATLKRGTATTCGRCRCRRPSSSTAKAKSATPSSTATFSSAPNPTRSSRFWKSFRRPDGLGGELIGRHAHAAERESLIEARDLRMRAGGAIGDEDRQEMLGRRLRAFGLGRGDFPVEERGLIALGERRREPLIEILGPGRRRPAVARHLAQIVHRATGRQ